ncbi:uncharacterized protein LOC144045064 isoform X2 [Vanacampus margaritifer]
MNPHKHVAYSNTSQLARTATRRQNDRVNEQPNRVPEDLNERKMHSPMKTTTVPKSRSTSAMVTGARTAQTLPVLPFPHKWKPSFKPIDKEDPEDESQEQSNEEGTELYEPFDPPMEGLPDINLWEINSNSPPEGDDNLKWESSPPEGDDNLEWQHVPLDRSNRVTPSWISGRDLDIHDLSPESRLGESHIGSPGHQRPAEQRSYSPDMKLIEPLGYRSSQRSFSPDRCTCSPQYSASYGRARTKGEEMISPEHRSPMVPRVRLSSPMLQRDYEIEEPVEAEPENDARMASIKRKVRKSVQMDQITVNCDLCNIEVSNGQELAKHLQSKMHWETMEHIQQQNNSDDMTIAFLQVLVSTAATAVDKHKESPQHLFNTKDFTAQRRRTSLAKADTIMKVLQPQFENFIKGCSEFE